MALAAILALAPMDIFGLAAGTIGLSLGLLGFAQHNFIEVPKQGVGFRFAVGLDGSGPRNAPLHDAGGSLPDIRVFDEEGNLIGTKIDDHNGCSSGSTNCDILVEHVSRQPTYTLFTGNDNAVCMAWVTVTFPEGTQYAWNGNWAQACNKPWYYSDIYVAAGDGSGSKEVMCAWIDKDGTQPTTGLQVHWPSFGNDPKAHDMAYYCHTPSVMTFHEDPDPWTVIHAGKRSDMSLKRSDVSPKSAEPASFRLQKKMSRDTRLVKSKANSHRATRLCQSESSVGPSLVSYEERKFCHMADRKIYPFCADTEKGDCWDDKKNEIVHKGHRGVVKRAAHPAVAFTETLHWGEK